MNLSKPDDHSVEKLRDIFASADDSAGHHVLWVNKEGEVVLEVLEHDESTQDFVSHREKFMKFRFPSMDVNNGYVGPAAAADEPYLQKTYDDLLEHWASNSEGPVGDF